jgi:hypothetical protein
MAALCLYGAATFIYAPVISDHPYGYDEADYMWAGKQGLWANYSSRHAISFVEFVRKGLELSRDSGKRQSFSEYIRTSGDIDFYRHYHGPMYAYWLALLRDAGVRGENVFRGSGLLIHFATATLILFGMWALFPSLPPIAALMACALFVFDRAALTAASGITQHVLFTFFCVASLLACSMFARNLESRWFYATVALIACAVCTVETSVLLLGALGLTMIVEHRRVREKWPTLKALGGLMARGTGVFLLTILICWPMGLLQLGIAKGFLGLIYIAVYRKTFSPVGPLGLWAAEFRVSPAEFTLRRRVYSVAAIRAAERITAVAGLRRRFRSGHAEGDGAVHLLLRATDGGVCRGHGRGRGHTLEPLAVGWADRPRSRGPRQYCDHDDSVSRSAARPQGGRSI